MKIIVTGTRGIPGIQGGVETHCEELFPRVADQNHEIIVVRRPQFKQPGFEETTYKGVTIKDLRSLSGKYMEALMHTISAVCYARSINADIVHIHAIGPALAAPLARMLGMKVVVTHHGPDYDRQKWGKFSKRVLKTGERLGAKYANRVIVISKHIEDMLQTKYRVGDKLCLIHNGVKLSAPSVGNFVDSLGLEPQKYILAVGRFVEEKGFDLLINAFSKADHGDLKLVIAGDADHPDQYSEKLKKMATENGVILTGFIQKEQLAQLYAATRLFVLPSYHEGLPISLLEAMNCHCDVLVSDIPANKEVGLVSEDYFRCGDEESLISCLKIKMSEVFRPRKYNMDKYDWEFIAEKTKEVYDDLFIYLIIKTNLKKIYVIFRH